MSWFEKAKSAIIEALDIQDDEEEQRDETTNKESVQNVVEERMDIATTSAESSQPNPATGAATTMLSSWGSFKGSFFENPKTNEMVTTAPKAAGSITKKSLKESSSVESEGKSSNVDLAKVSEDKEDSVSLHSNNDMVEQVITVPPKATTPKSRQESFSEKTAAESQVLAVSPKTPGSALSGEFKAGFAKRQILPLDENSQKAQQTIEADLQEDENKAGGDSSVSLSDSSVVVLPNIPSDLTISFVQRQISETSGESSQEKALLVSPVEMGPKSVKASSTGDSVSSLQSSIVMLIDSDKTSPNMQNSVDSDSTQSFEDIQMQASCQTIPSEEKSDFEKIDSKSHSSPPHSNDEMETATSSDIEIISHPNGDSSSTNSTNRTSPLKIKKSFMPQGPSPDQQPSTSSKLYEGHKRGHYREASEISILSEDSQTEAEKLAQRINELNEILEAREMRLLQSERTNAALRERNEELQKTVDTLKSNTTLHDSTKQLSILEKKFQTALQEGNALRIQITALKNEMKEMIPKNELLESKTLVDELRLEGEKLSKEVLQHSNIIKKLRAKEKTSDATLKKNAEQLAQLNEEVERLKKTLVAKEDVERTQIETIHRLSSEKQKLFEETSHQRSKIEDLQSKLSTLQSSFEAAKTELQQRSRLFNDISKTAETAEAAKEAKQKAEQEKQELLQQMTELREKLRSTEENMSKREQKLREDNKELQRLFEAAELRAEASTQDVSLATIPLLRQIESLQKTLNSRTAAWNKDEKHLLEKLAKLETRLASVEKSEAFLQEQTKSLKSRCMDLEERLSQVSIEAENAKISLRQVESNYELYEAKAKRQILQLSGELEASKTKVLSLKEQIKDLEAALQNRESANVLSNRVLTEAAVNEASKLSEPSHSHLQDHQQTKASPPNSCGVNSLEDAIGGSIDWHNDDLDCVSNAGQHATNFGQGLNFNFMSMTTSTLEHLQSLLKQRDGEISHLQWELSRLQVERNALSEEIASLTMELENLKERISQYEIMQSSYNDLQTRYEALLEMFGEKVERMQELELDLIEARQAYKIQIDELLSQKSSNTSTGTTKSISSDAIKERT